MVYTPEHVKGQILVKFKVNASEGFARDFGKSLNYELLDEDLKRIDAFLYSVPKGEEQKSADVFSGYRELVEWSSLRDRKLTSRWGGLEEVAKCVENLCDDVELSDVEYNTKLDEIIEKAKDLKV